MNKIRHTVLGLFLLASLALLGVVTIGLGDGSLFGDEGQRHQFFFDNVDGLEEGNPVTVHGVKLGKVEAIDFTEGNERTLGRLKVTVLLQQEVELGEDSVVRITSQSLLGGRRIEIEMEAPEVPEPDAEGLRSEVDRGFARAISGLVEENREDLHRILDSLAVILGAMARGEKVLGDYVLSEQALGDLYLGIAHGRQLLSDVVEGEGSVALALRNPTLYQEAVAALQGANSILDAVNEGDGSLALLLRESTLHDHAAEILRVARQFAEATERGEGLLGRSLSPESEAIFEDAAAIVADFRHVMARVRAGDGALGLALSDPVFRTRLERIAANAESLSAQALDLVLQATDGKGLVGYLLNDPEAVRAVRRMVAAVTGAVEDAREAAPVSSFASFLFGQF